MNTTPRISLIICTYNRDKFLLGCFEAITKQSLQPDQFEIIIVNNNSTDNTETISKKFIEEHPKLNIKYFIEKEKGLSAARNRGIKESSAKLVSFIDDDAEITKDHLKTAVEFFDNNPNVDALGGKIIPIFESGDEPKWLSKYMWGLVTKADFGEKVREYPNAKFPYGCNMAFRKNVLYEIGLFNTSLTFRSEDKYIFSQLKKNGKKFLYHPSFAVFHHIDNKRITHESIMKISLDVGSGERARLKDEGLIKNISKVFEYILKFIAALLIAVMFLMKGEVKKAEYLVKNRWLTLIGFFK